MISSTRRVFMLQVVAGSSALAAGAAMAQAAPPKVSEKDPQAMALGYSEDSTKVDPKKYPKHTAEQKCSTCQLFVAKGKDPYGNCPLYAGKVVAATGWCSAYAKKA
jgi:hypothetical protein